MGYEGNVQNVSPAEKEKEASHSFLTGQQSHIKRNKSSACNSSHFPGPDGWTVVLVQVLLRCFFMPRLGRHNTAQCCRASKYHVGPSQDIRYLRMCWTTVSRNDYIFLAVEGQRWWFGVPYICTMTFKALCSGHHIQKAAQLPL